MTNERYEEMFDLESKFTEEELAQGWHFCG